MQPWGREWAGRLDRLSVKSEMLAGNVLGDPAERPLWVYTPPGYDADTDRRYPSVYVLQGYSGFLNKWANRDAFRVPYPEMVDDVFARGDVPPCLVVFVDAWTAYGGSQFVDSPGTGRYHSYLCDEIVPLVDARYRTLADPAHRGLQGKSSGGFGALITPMLRPDLFGGLASHAGDALYESLYIPEFAKTARVLRGFGGSIHAWWEDFTARLRARTPMTEPLTRPDDMTALMVLGVSACFSADDDGTPILPFNPRTGQLIEDVWERWLAWDPVRMVPRYADALQGLKAVWLDGGTSDEWFLELGAEAVRDQLAGIGVTDVHFELFDGRHGGIDWRYPLSLSYLATRLTPQ